MSYCKREGKDKAIFVTKEDATDPNALNTLIEDESYGLILNDGSINWDCPCLGGMAHGPCGDEFKNAFSCFHYSKEEMKGQDCVPQFREMQECFLKYPEVYSKFTEDDKNPPNSDESNSTNKNISKDQTPDTDTITEKEL